MCRAIRAGFGRKLVDILHVEHTIKIASVIAYMPLSIDPLYSQHSADILHVLLVQADARLWYVVVPGYWEASGADVRHVSRPESSTYGKLRHDHLST